MRWSVIIALSIGFHLLIARVLVPRSPRVDEPEIPLPAETIKLRLTTRTEVAVISAPKTPIVAPTAPEHARIPTPKNPSPASNSGPRPKPRSQTSPRAKIPSYGALFPSWNDMAAPHGDARHGRGGRGSPAQRSVGRRLGATFDIPLALRNVLRDGKAVIKLTRLHQKRLRIDYVSGAPPMRAILFETVKDPAHQRLINETFAVLGAESIIIGLRFAVEQGLAASPEERFQVAIRDTRLTITRIRWPEDRHGAIPGRGDPHIPKLKGIPLPDKHAEKARRRDRIHLRRLRQSPAYISPVRGRIIDW